MLLSLTLNSASERCDFFVCHRQSDRYSRCAICHLSLAFSVCFVVKIRKIRAYNQKYKYFIHTSSNALIFVNVYQGVKRCLVGPKIYCSKFQHHDITRNNCTVFTLSLLILLSFIRRLVWLSNLTFLSSCSFAQNGIKKWFLKRIMSTSRKMRREH